MIAAAIRVVILPLPNNDTDHQVAGVISPLSKRTIRRLWCIRLGTPGTGVLLWGESPL